MHEKPTEDIILDYVLSDLLICAPNPQFHADNLSSAHIYLRLQEGQTWNTIPTALIEDCAQLTKAGSIEGRKAYFSLLLRRIGDKDLLNYAGVVTHPVLRTQPFSFHSLLVACLYLCGLDTHSLILSITIPWARNV